MDFSAVLTLVQTLVQLIDSPTIGSAWSFNYPLAELKDTLCYMEATLTEAANFEKHQLGDLQPTIRRQIQNLQNLMYDVEDLLDEVNYFAQLKKVLSGGNRLTKEVQLFFSPNNHLVFANKMNKKINKIKEKLDDFKNNANIFKSLDIPHESTSENRVPLRERVRQARTFVHTSEIIGRDGDKKAVMNLLRDANNVQQHLHFVTIFGIGGMGKTTLARLICNDIKNEFDEYLYVCVGDIFSLESILRELLRQLKVDVGTLGFNLLDQEFMEKIKGTKYLMLLDDVWSVDHGHWQKLKELLEGGEQGSKIIVTTRSEGVATRVGGEKHELTGLTPDDSWKLFKIIALGTEEDKEDDEERLKIGKHIVTECSHVPLAIRAVASLLWNQDISKWQEIKLKTNIAAVVKKSSRDSCGILPILKLSYYDLDPEIRRCFSFCAMFPKDYVLDKETLIYLWMAHGWILPEEGQSLDEVGEYYFKELQQKGFIMADWKIHDLMHDVAQDVAGAEILVLSSNATQFPKSVRHTSYYGKRIAKVLPDKLRTIRTIFDLEEYYMSSETPIISDKINFSKVKYLRALGIPNLHFERLPKSFNKLIHLRFLDISYSQQLEVLPDSLVDLINLNVLFIRHCKKLTKLPKRWGKLVNLRHLDNDGCNKLRLMPPGIKNMAQLQQLTEFVVNQTSCGCNDKQAQSSRLEDIKDLTNLKGSLRIRVVQGKLGSKEVAHVLEDKLLNDLSIEWDERRFEDESGEDGEALLERLHPHPSLRVLCLTRYPGRKFEGWASLEKFENCLPHLVDLSIMDCQKLERLPSFSQLHLLKELDIRGLNNLEYMEFSKNNGGISNCTTLCSTSATVADSEGVLFFPVLERLSLLFLPKFKGWKSAPRLGQLQQQQQEMLIFPNYAFPRLSYLEVVDCPKLLCIPLAPNLGDVRVRDAPAATWGISNSSCECSWKEWSMETDNVSILKDLPVEHFQSLVKLTIEFNDECRWSMVFPSSNNLSWSLRTLYMTYCQNLKSLCGVGLEHLTNLESLKLCALDKLDEMEDENGMPWKSLHSNLRHLELSSMESLRSMCGVGLEHLTNLESLELWWLDKLDEMEDENGMPWKALHPNLHHLKFASLTEMKRVPDGIQYLTSLQSLSISYCEVEALPDWMTSLTSLHSLSIFECPVVERCKEPNGEEWPKIKHIPKRDLARAGL